MKFLYKVIILLAFISGCTFHNRNSELSNSSIGIETYGYDGFTYEEVEIFNQRMIQDGWAWFGEGGDLNRYVHLHMSDYFGHEVISRSNRILVLEESSRIDVRNFLTQSKLGELPLLEYVANDNVDGLIILHNGKIVFEGYPRMSPNEFHIWYSISKILVSVSLAVLEERNQLDTSNPIDFYLSELANTEWEGIPVVDILSMSSGINCPEIHSGPGSECFNKVMQAYGFPQTENALENPLTIYKELKAAGNSGELYDYTSVNTALLTILLEYITKTSFADFIEREIWQKIGAENIGLMLKASYGRDASMLGMNSCLRDVGRFGLLFTEKGLSLPEPIISKNRIEKIQYGVNQKLKTESTFTGLQKFAGYQFDDIYEDGDMYKHGHAGQGLYISPTKNLVIAFFGTYTAGNMENELPNISRQLALSGLFDK